MMKVRNVKITIKNRKQVLHEFAVALSSARKGKPIKKRDELSFNSMESLRSILTEKRIGLLRIIRQKNPDSIYKLAKKADRDLKSVNTDIDLLKDLGLVTLEEIHSGRRKMKPIVKFDRLNVEIAI